MKKNKYEIDMCNGTIMDKLISFALPLMLSGMLQLTFNAVDIVVIGQFSGKQSLAAVGATTALINVFTNLFIGISLGANVIAARFYAAGRDKEMSETVHTAISLALISGIVMGIVGIVFSHGALQLMGTPSDVIDLSTLYMRIYFIGMPFFMLYNYGAAILRAVGDTKRPLMFLIISGVVNAALNRRGGCCNRNGCLAVSFLYSGFALSLSYRGKLSASLFKIMYQRRLCEADFSGWHTGRSAKYGYQFLQCIVAVIGKFVWFYRDGGIYGCEQPAWLFVYVHQLGDTGMYEFYKPEFWCREV